MSEHSNGLRIPPQSIESECGLLGGLLLNNDLISNVDLKPADFYRLENGLAFRAITELISTGKPADVITVHEHLKAIGKDQDVGGIDYLNQLAQYIPSTTNLSRYSEIIREKSIMRQLIRVGDEIVQDGLASEGVSASDQLTKAEAKLEGIGNLQSTLNHESAKLSNLMARLNDKLISQSENPGSLVGISTGYKDIDEAFNGMKPGQMIVVAGRPSMGKTSLAMNIAEHSIKTDLPVLVFSLEMSAEELGNRLIGSVGRVDQTKLAKSDLTNTEWSRVSEAMEGMIKKDQVEVRDGSWTIGDIRAEARRFKQRNKKVGLIVVDYIQLVTGTDDTRQQNRTSEVSSVTRGLKLLAGEIGCPVIALSQLNRGVEDRMDKRPRMSDLRESGSIEQDADIIMFVYRDEVYTGDACQTPGVAEIIVAKQRNGPVGTVRLAWNPNYTRFDSLAC